LTALAQQRLDAGSKRILPYFNERNPT
jgi:hypothetical protein